MPRYGLRSRTADLILLALFANTLVAPVLFAAIRGPGKYNGVVFFDRWDNCYLLSSVYLMYISGGAKESLRPYSGKSIEIDAREVDQPMNPGDGLIRKLEVIGESREHSQSVNQLPPIRGVALQATVARVAGEFKAEIEISNHDSAEVTVNSGELGFAVIAQGKPSPLLCPSDGTSCAVITRVSAISPDGEYRTVVTTKRKADSYVWGWTYGSDRFPRLFTLRPGEMRIMSVILNLHSGAYQFIAGYGGGVHAGPSVASNAVDFDVPSQ